MPCLVDTCVLLRAFDKSAPHYQAILATLRQLADDGTQFFVTVQNIAEFWNVSTRPLDKNGQGISVEQTNRRIRIIERFATVCPETLASYAQLKVLLRDHAIMGVQVHDARLVSVMMAEGISSLLTLNPRDFRRFTHITVLEPVLLSPPWP